MKNLKHLLFSTIIILISSCTPTSEPSSPTETVTEEESITNSESFTSEESQTESSVESESDSSSSEESESPSQTESDSSSSEESQSPSESESSSSEESESPSSSESDSSSSEEVIEDPYAKYWTYDGTYYDTLDLTLTGEDLKSALNVIVNKNARNTSYSGLRSAYKYTDVDPENENNIILYYTGESRAFLYGQSTAFQGSINREHVWPQSRYASLGKKQANTPYDDILNVRPSDKNVNSGRGNGLFDYGLNEPNDNYKGDVARVLLYVATRYKTLSLVDNTTGGNNSMGKLSTLLEWNLKYPVSDVVLRRNDGAQIVQNNRNPYIDNPGFACAIWGSTNANTKAVCDKYQYNAETTAHTNTETQLSCLSNSFTIYYDPKRA